jgi:ribosomal protein L37AE/L43A
MAKTKKTPENKVPKKPSKPAGRPSSKSVKTKSPKLKDVSNPKIYNCSFCGKSSEASKRLIAGPNKVFICDKCVEVCVAVLFEDDRKDCIYRLVKIITGESKLVFKNEKPKAIIKEN